jgi:oligopeptide/dipeptide ABC transporter ATP-binding protein
MQDRKTGALGCRKGEESGMPQVQLSEESGTAANKEVLLRVSNLMVTFRKGRTFFGTARSNQDIRAVDGISFDIYGSEIVSLVGESGSGKTTLARCLVGLIPVTSGSILYKNEVDVTKLSGSSLRQYLHRVQIIYQDPFESLDPGQNVFSIIASPIKNLVGEKDRTVIRSRVFELLNEMGLDPEEVVSKYPHQLSGGQRQRVNIARALAPDPEFLIADEPITMLDAGQRLKILALLKRLQKNRSLSILLITHDLASAKIMSERIFVMYLGKIVEYGRTVDILSKPHHPYVELILQSTPRLVKQKPRVNSDELSWIEQSEKVKEGCAFEPRCKYSTDICRTTVPLLSEKSKDDYAACHNPLNSS